MSSIKLIDLSGNERKGKEKNTTSTSTNHNNKIQTIKIKVGRRSPAHHESRNKSVVKAYRSGYPQKNIAAKIGVSVRQVANIINKMCKSSSQRQKWYDEHEANAVKYRTGRQQSQHRFKPLAK